jgi:hypothetical protein
VADEMWGNGGHSWGDGLYGTHGGLLGRCGKRKSRASLWSTDHSS